MYINTKESITFSRKMYFSHKPRRADPGRRVDLWRGGGVLQKILKMRPNTHAENSCAKVSRMSAKCSPKISPKWSEIFGSVQKLALERASGKCI